MNIYLNFKIELIDSKIFVYQNFFLIHQKNNLVNHYNEFDSLMINRFLYEQNNDIHIYERKENLM